VIYLKDKKKEERERERKQERGKKRKGVSERQKMCTIVSTTVVLTSLSHTHK